MHSTITDSFPFALIDAIIVIIPGLLSTLAIGLWIAIIVIRHISSKHRSCNSIANVGGNEEFNLGLKKTDIVLTEVHISDTKEDTEVQVTEMNGSVCVEDIEVQVTAEVNDPAEDTEVQVGEMNSSVTRPAKDTKVQVTDEPDGEIAEKMDKCLNIERSMHRCVRYFLPVLKRGSSDSKTNIQTVLLNRVVPSIFMEQLLLFTFVVVALSLHVFISSYLFIKSYGCSTEPYVHCFEAKVHFLVISDTKLDCGNDTAIENVTSIICYDLTLNATRAISAAGATLAGAAFYFAMITWVLLRLSNIKRWRYTTSKLSKKFICITSIQVVITIIALVIVLAREVALILDRDTVYEDFIYAVINIYVVILGGAIPWWRFKLREPDS